MIVPRNKLQEQQFKFAELTSKHSTTKKKRTKTKKDHTLKCSTSGEMNRNKI
jgi:hypothetical protein